MTTNQWCLGLPEQTWIKSWFNNKKDPFYTGYLNITVRWRLHAQSRCAILSHQAFSGDTWSSCLRTDRSTVYHEVFEGSLPVFVIGLFHFNHDCPLQCIPDTLWYYSLWIVRFECFDMNKQFDSYWRNTIMCVLYSATCSQTLVYL